MPTLGFFPGLSGHDTGLVHTREKEIVSDLFQTVLVWAYGLGGRAGVMHGGQLEKHPRVTWMGIPEHDAYVLSAEACLCHARVCVSVHLASPVSTSYSCPSRPGGNTSKASAHLSWLL